MAKLLHPIVNKLLNKNIYSLDIATKLAFFNKNRRTLKTLKYISQIDPIFDFEEFKETVVEYKNTRKPGWLGINEIGGDSPLYGHLKNLCEYAGKKYHNYYRLLLPAIEHGIRWLDTSNKSDFLPYIHCIVSQGPYRHSSIRKRSNIPHYIIGPYIHYSNSYYDNPTLEKLKKRYGKVLLVFPAHTYEFATISYAKKEYVNKLMNKVAAHFDSVIVSAYWNDVDDPLFSYFKSSGAYIVSSGLREDLNFLSRLKSLLMLSDATTGNALGTNIGYSIYLNKPFIYFDGNSDIDFKDSTYSTFESKNKSEQLDSIYSYGKSIFNNSADFGTFSQQQKLFYEKYWGGESYIKSPEEINAIFNISSKALKRSHGNTHSLQLIYNQELINSIPEDSLEFQLLNNALD